MRYKVGLLVIATNNYINFIPKLRESVSRYFLNRHDITFFLFTDRKAPDGVVKIPHEHQQWPYPTLMRYHTFSKHQEKLFQMDYLYYCDADMKFVANVGDEILGELVATKHPGFYDRPRHEFTYERRKESAAFVDLNEGIHYFAGGFNGGRADRFLELAEDIAQMIDRDLSRRIIAVWHDESYLNRYLIDTPPTKILSPSYCYPEWEGWTPPFPPKLIALEKNHAAMKGVLYGEPRTPMKNPMRKLFKKAIKKSFNAFGFELRRIHPTESDKSLSLTGNSKVHYLRQIGRKNIADT